MSEEIKEAPKRRGGWPKGKPRTRTWPPEQLTAAAVEAPRLISKMKARPNWESEDYVGVGMDGVDRLKVPDEVVEALRRDGIALQWVTRSVRGQETPQELSKMTRGGWTPVHQSDFDSLLDGMFMPKGHDEVITVDDCMLVARPIEIHQKAKVMEKKDARRPLEISEAQLGSGIPNVTGSNHPTATFGNKINKTLERVEIPE